MRMRFSLALAVAAIVAGGASPQAVETCHYINAEGIGSLTSPTTTESRIIGGGLIHGSTTADLVFTGSEGAIFFFEGTLTLTTRQGTLSLDIIDGVFDTSTGEFSSGSTATGGTGRFDGATGSLYFHGFVLADGVTFIDDEISGHICLELP